MTETPGDARAGRGISARVAEVLHGARWTIRTSRAALLVAPLLVLIVPFLFIGQEVTAPSWVRERVEASAASALGGGSLRFDAITVRLPRDLHPEVRLLGVVLSDREGRLVARVPEVTAQVSPRGLVFERRPLLQEIALRGAELSLARAVDGSVDLAFGGDGPARGLGRAEGLLSLPEQFERLFERPALEALRHVRIDGLVVNYSDSRAGRTWTLDDGSLSLDLSDGTTRLTGEAAVLSGRSYVTRARIDYESPLRSPSARISVVLTDVAAADVASQSAALTWLRVVDAPISLSLRSELDDQGALGPTSVALKIAKGELRPQPAVEPVGFDVARAYLSYDPKAQAVRFQRVEVRSDWGGVLASGRADLREVEAGLPRALLGQFTLREIALDPPGLYDQPAQLPEATAQFRLRLDPFTVDIAQASLALTEQASARIDLHGSVGATSDGWEVLLDAELGAVERSEVLALWPERFRPGLRDWLDANLPSAVLRDVAAALRIVGGGPPRFALTSGFEGAEVRPLATHPPILDASGRLAWEDGTFSAALDAGRVEAPEGGTLNVAGTAIVIPPGQGGRSPATVHLDASGPIPAALSYLDVPGWAFLSSAGLPVTLADGQASASGTLDVFLGGMTTDELDFEIVADLTGVRSEVLVPGHVLTAESVTATATPEGLEIAGPARVGPAAVQGVWRQGFAPDARGLSRLEAEVEITPASLAEFGIALPDGSVDGSGTGTLEMDFAPDAPPTFRVTSTLDGLRLSLPEIGWTKPPSSGGELVVEGAIDAPVRVDRLALAAAGLTAEGDVRLTLAGAFDRLRLDRLRVGDWLDAPVTLTARPGSDVPAVAVTGGTLDLGRSAFGSGGGGAGEGGPLAVSLDRLQITDGIGLTGFAGEFDTTGGLEGAFTGRVNGGPSVTGRVAPQGDRVAARIQGPDAGAVMRAADLFTRAEGGALDLLLVPRGEASYDGQLWITDLKVREAPILASLLNAASVIGLLQQLGGQGILFDEVSADFRIDPTAVVVGRSSAVGAGLGISLSGVLDTENYLMDFEGVLSPLYLVNSIGSILTRPGEGLLGFNFRVRGSPDDPDVGVNPLSVLAPGALRDLLRQRPLPPGQ